MTHIIDRRAEQKNKSAVNRRRLIKRFKTDLRRAVTDAFNKRSITDTGGEDIPIPSRDLQEPTFTHAKGGVRESVHAGNRKYVPGDLIDRPDEESRHGGGGGSQGGNGSDTFVFSLTREEFLDILFDDLELPNLLDTAHSMLTQRTVRAGHTPSGNPANIEVIRSLKASLARRLALGGSESLRLQELETVLDSLRRAGVIETDERLVSALQEIEEIRARRSNRPFIDTHDIRYKNFVQILQPTCQAVMVCIMDVSGSMDKVRKDMAKRFFLLLHLFLERQYEKIEIVFIRHHSEAFECSEHDFFHKPETGGTIVSSALKLSLEMIRERFNPEQWNIYIAQASDGENFMPDNNACSSILMHDILPYVRLFAYVETKPRDIDLWNTYTQVQTQVSKNLFVMHKLHTDNDVLKVFLTIFKRQR